MTLMATHGRLLSNPAVARAYPRLRRWLEAASAVVFGGGAVHPLAAREP